MPINVKKLDGTLEPLDMNKILRWGSWAASESPDISFESVLTFTSTAFYDGVTTSELTEALCKSCEDLARAASDEKDFRATAQYNKLARNLYIPSIIKKANYFQSKFMTDSDILSGYEFKISDGNVVPLPRFKLKSVIRAGVELKTYDPLLLDGSITDEVFDFADSIVDYTRMNKLWFNGLRQLEAKYLRRTDGTLLEDPQQAYILAAIAATHADIPVYPEGHTVEFQKESIENYYRIFSQGEMNIPTPIMLSLRTDFKQYDSCCLFSIGDENRSIEAGMSVAQQATVAGAGLGVNLGRVRSKGTRFRKQGVHQGVLGYLGQLTKTTKASNQESRRWWCNSQFPVMD